MSVLVHCSECAAELTVDEGFRGGVCRCSSCGTLLAVPNEQGAVGAPRRRQRPATPNQDPSLLRQNQEDLKQRTGSFPALTELIGSSSGLQGMRRPAQPVAGDPGASALGLSPPSPLGEAAGPDDSAPRDDHSVLDKAASDLPEPEAPENAPVLEVGASSSPAGAAPEAAAGVASAVEPAGATPSQAPARGRIHPLVYVALGILTGVLLILAISYLWRSGAPAPHPSQGPESVTPQPAVTPPAPSAAITPSVSTAPAPSSVSPVAGAETAPSPAPAPVPETLPAAGNLPAASAPAASKPASEPAPAPASQPASEPAATAP
ncbi:MAG TPA: hypothetical protein VH253_04485 [Phycisphaerae bacterium]|nr:hypothetical protein [Phycisphaerae bacterium]